MKPTPHPPQARYTCLRRAFFLFAVLAVCGVNRAGAQSADAAVGGLQPGLAAAHPAPAERPALMLANVYTAHTDLSAYWVSEKYDGVRAIWNGHHLSTRGGQRIQAPPWFTAGWPDTAMDGELWAGRGRFQQAVSAVRQQVPDDAQWRAMRFMMFDLPNHPGEFSQRLEASAPLVSAIGQPWVQAVPQWRVATHAELQRQLRQMDKAGGEGLMLHRAASLYRAGRSDDLLKVKTHGDAEARVVGHQPGQGRHTGQLGALLVETPDGRRFKLGSGFSQAQRSQPPAVGTWVTYRYRGLNPSGLPRFASFLRERTDWPNGPP